MKTINIDNGYSMVKHINGTKHWFLNGQFHRENDLPAIEDSNGSKHWYLNGQLHRENGPAIEYPDGTKHWFLNDKRHRENGPAIEWPDGTKEWFLNDKRHRENGPAIEFPSGTKHWYLNGQLHRENGPAVEWSDGDKWWYFNGIKLFEKDFNSIQKLMKDKKTMKRVLTLVEWFVSEEILKATGIIPEFASTNDELPLWKDHYFSDEPLSREEKEKIIEHYLSTTDIGKMISNSKQKLFKSFFGRDSDSDGLDPKIVKTHAGGGHVSFIDLISIPKNSSENFISDDSKELSSFHFTEIENVFDIENI